MAPKPIWSNKKRTKINVPPNAKRRQVKSAVVRIPKGESYKRRLTMAGKWETVVADKDLYVRTVVGQRYLKHGNYMVIP